MSELRPTKPSSQRRPRENARLRAQLAQRTAALQLALEWAAAYPLTGYGSAEDQRLAESLCDERWCQECAETRRFLRTVRRSRLARDAVANARNWVRP